jgi:hypothetical protein
VATGTSIISATLDGVSGSTVLNVGAQVLNPNPNDVKDNSKGGYYQYGKWTVSAGGYQGSYAVANPTASPSAIAEWLVNVPAGNYQIWATWVSSNSNATNSTFSIYDGFDKLGSASENEQVAPAEAQYGGVFWAELGSYAFANGRATIALSASGANGNIVADGVLLIPVAAASVISRPPSGSPGTPAPVTNRQGTLPSPDSSTQGSATAPLTALSPAPVKMVSRTIATITPLPIKVHYTAGATKGKASRQASYDGSLGLSSVGRHSRRRHGDIVQKPLIRR